MNNGRNSSQKAQGAEWLAVGLALGSGIGVALGVVLGSIALGLVGSSAGLLLGAAIMAVKRRDDSDDQTGEM